VLDYIERIHPKSIQLGLERVAKVRDMLARSSSAALFTVAGTNGKGSTCAMLEAILIAAGYRVGLSLRASPSYNEARCSTACL